MSLTGYERLPFDSQRRLDDTCARFERGWAGASPDRLAEQLAAAPPEEADVWLTELLHIEVERARRAGAAPLAGTYRARLPAFAAVIGAVFAEYPAKVGPGDSVGKYRLIRPLGRGASGTVFEAEDPVIGRRVALKLLTGPSVAARTVQEARIVGRLQHPNIVTVYDAGSADGVWYIAMELLTGSTADRLKEHGPFAPEEATRIAADVCRGLAAAHAAGLVHRDIKPANVLLSPVDASRHPPVAKLSDFGLARATRDGDETGGTAGTPLYMPPEQFDGRELGPAADIYSLGATYFALLTGRPPYQAGGVLDLQRAHETAPAPLVTTGSGEALPAHSRVVARAMAKLPAERYSSSDEMLADLASLLPRRPASPGRPRRYAIVGCTAVLVAALALAVPGPAEWVASRLDRQRRAAPALANPAWAPLFNGRDLTGWSAPPRPDGTGAVSVVAGDEPVVRIGGDAAGSIVTDRDYENYHVRMEVRWPRPGQPFSGGLRYHTQRAPTGDPDSKGWDEFSLVPATVGEYGHSPDRVVRPAMFREGRLALSSLNGLLEPPASDVSRAGGRWHRVELVCWGTVSVHGVSGTATRTRLRSASAGGRAFTRGRIEIRTVHGSIDVRRIEIRPVAGVPAELQSRGE